MPRSVKDILEHADELSARFENYEPDEQEGYSWAFIGQIIGTSGEAARQRYGHKSDA